MCTYIHQHEGVAGVRRLLGVLALAKKHGPAVVDDAAKAALDLGVPTFRFLRRYLERRLPAPLTLRQVDPLIRQLSLYRDLIDRKTGDPCSPALPARADIRKNEEPLTDPIGAVLQ